MKDAIKFSEKAYFKLFEVYFKKVSTNWILSAIAWLIDSKYRTYKRLDIFLKEQLENPDSELFYKAKEFKKYNYNRRIIEILKFVRQRILYASDFSNWGKSEYWATAKEVMERRSDDCDGINTLIYILARLSGIPSFSLYCAIGETAGGGHFWCIYIDPKSAGIYAIDGTYMVDLTDIPKRRKFAYVGYKKIWYIFNDDLVMKPISI